MSIAVIYRTDGSKEELDHVPQLEEAQKIVGGYVEVVKPATTPAVFFLCNEEGILKNLPINEIGCLIYGGMIAGDIVVMVKDEKNYWLI